MEHFYIESAAYNIQTRQIKRGTVYDVYFYVWTLDGHHRQKRICGFDTKAKAKAAHSKFITEHCSMIEKGAFRQQKQSTKRNISVEVAVSNFIASLSNKAAEGGIYDKMNIYKLFLLPYLGEKSIDQLNVETIRQWQNEIWALKMKGSTEFYSYAYLNKIRGQVSSFLSWVEDEYKIPNALLQIKKPKRIKPKEPMRFWTREQFQQFINAVDEPVYHALFMTLFFTGRRKGEVLALTPADIKPDRIIITKAVSTKTMDGSAWKIAATKNKKNGETFICAPLKEEYAQYQIAGKFVFGGDRPLPETTIARKFNQWIQLAGVPRIRIHDLRHSFVSMCFSLGANITVIADLIGDTIEQVSRTYAHMYESDKMAIIAKMS